MICLPFLFPILPFAWCHPIKFELWNGSIRVTGNQLLSLLTVKTVTESLYFWPPCVNPTCVFWQWWNQWELVMLTRLRGHVGLNELASLGQAHPVGVRIPVGALEALSCKAGKGPAQRQPCQADFELSSAFSQEFTGTPQPQAGPFI